MGIIQSHKHWSCKIILEKCFQKPGRSFVKQGPLDFWILASCGGVAGNGAGEISTFPRMGTLTSRKARIPFSNSQIPDIDNLGQNLKVVYQWK
jgi:hypothetical protein